MIPSGVAVVLRRGHVRERITGAFHAWELSGERGDDADMRLAFALHMHGTIVDVHQTS